MNFSITGTCSAVYRMIDRPVFVRVFPYAAVFFMAEVVHAASKAVFINGSNAGIISASLMTVLLCVLMTLVYLGFPAARFVLIMFYIIHAAFTLSMIAESLYTAALPAPPWLFILRLCFLPFEMLLPAAVLMRERERSR